MDFNGDLMLIQWSFDDFSSCFSGISWRFHETIQWLWYGGMIDISDFAAIHPVSIIAGESVVS